MPCPLDALRQRTRIDGRSERDDAPNVASRLEHRRSDGLARDPEADAMDREPPLPLVAVPGVARLHNAFDPHEVSRQLGEGILELLEIEDTVDG